MKIGIDSYCYHRFFGEVYPQQRKPDRGMTLEQFILRAHELGAEGVSLESCFLPSVSAEYLGEVRAMLDEHRLDRVYAWGHPDGLERGTNRAAYAEMIASFEYAWRIGAKVMRVVGSSLRFRLEPHAPQLERLTAMFRSAADVARDYDLRLAVENHIDFTADEMVQLLDAVDSPYVGINFDTGNFLRLLDDPVRGMEKLAPRVYATHIKDLRVQRGVSPDEWFFFSSVPVGEGLVDNAKLVRSLAKAGFDGILAVEIDFLHPDYNEDEDTAVATSVQELKRLVEQSRSGPAVVAIP
jgi:3-oxoisoapionate decarboxylase